MKTLLTLGLYPSSGGPSKSVRAFQSALEASVISWVDPKERELDELIWQDSIEVTGSKVPLLKQLQYPSSGVQEAETIIARSKLVSVHSFWRWHVLWVRAICQKYNVPYWFVPHGSLDPYVVSGKGALAKRAFMVAGGAAFLRDAAAVIYSTTRERDKAVNIVGHNRSEVIYWPLQQEDFAIHSRDLRTSSRDRLGIPQDALCFLYLGRLSPMKRPLETIEAFAKSNNQSAHLIVVGNDFGVTKQECQSIAKHLGVSDRCHVVGAAYGTEKGALIAASDIYVSLSFRENFNFTAAEALAAGLELILSPGNDLAHEIKHLQGVKLLDDLDVLTASRAMRITRDPTAQYVEGINVRRQFALQFFGEDQFRGRLGVLAGRYAKNKV